LAAVCPLVFVACALAQPAPPSPADSGDDEVRELPEQQVDGKPDLSAWSRIRRWSDTRVRGVFDIILPDTQERRTWRLTFQPHFRDLISADYVRLPVGLIYGFNRRAEGEIDVDGFVANPFRGADDNAVPRSDAGISNIRTNFKYSWAPPVDRTISAASGVQWVRPIPSSPAALNEGVNRYSIYTTFARPSPFIPNLESFLNLSYDFITGSSALGEIPDDEPQDDFVKAATGVLYHRGPATWGLAVSWAHTVDGERTNFVTLTPSVIYDVPQRLTFNSPGRWQIGAALEGLRHGSENDVSLRVRVRWAFDFRKAVRDWRAHRAAAERAGLRSE
jgi:hypothetical protein